LCTTIFARIRVPFGAPLGAPIFVEEFLPMNIGPHTLAQQRVRGTDGRGDRPAVPDVVQGARRGYAVSEMAASNPRLRDSVKTQRRTDHAGETEPRAVQIAGADPQMMAQAARYNVERGAQIIDINMGCPARKVCNVMAGSALMADEPLALSIVAAVRAAVDVPVTVKMRTGPDPARRNAVTLARRLEQLGVAMITVHGRTRACAYRGQAEYDTIAEVKRARARAGRGQWRHRLAAQGPQLCCAHTGADADHDRPRGTGPALHLPRDRALPRHRGPALRRSPMRSARTAARAPRTTTTRSTANTPACAAPANTSAGTWPACAAWQANHRTASTPHPTAGAAGSARVVLRQPADPSRSGQRLAAESFRHARRSASAANGTPLTHLEVA
jgi:hypothetical protein